MTMLQKKKSNRKEKSMNSLVIVIMWKKVMKLIQRQNIESVETKIYFL